MYDISGLNEECGVFGIWNHQEAAQLTYMGLHSLQHRGQEGAGIVCSNGENLIGERGLVLQLYLGTCHYITKHEALQYSQHLS